MRRGYLALFTLAMIWGAAFLFIKLAVRDMSPGTLVLARAVFGAVTLGVIFAVRRQTPFPTGTRARLLPFLVMAIVGSLIPWVAIAFGEQSISSALASILNATTPLWTAVLAYWVTPTERPSGLNYLGVAIGFLGTGILIAPDLIGQPLRATTIGTLAVALAAPLDVMLVRKIGAPQQPELGLGAVVPTPSPTPPPSPSPTAGCLGRRSARGVCCPICRGP